MIRHKLSIGGDKWHCRENGSAAKCSSVSNTRSQSALRWDCMGKCGGWQGGAEKLSVAVLETAAGAGQPEMARFMWWCGSVRRWVGFPGVSSHPHFPVDIQDIGGSDEGGGLSRSGRCHSVSYSLLCAGTGSVFIYLALFSLSCAVQDLCSLMRDLSLWLMDSLVVMLRLRCPEACGIFQDQGSNPCPLRW